MHHSDPTCPSYVVYSVGHNGQTQKAGFTTTPDSAEPHIKQDFTCIEDIFVELCSSSTGTPTSGASTTYVETECEKIDAERGSTTMLGGAL